MPASGRKRRGSPHAAARRGRQRASANRTLSRIPMPLRRYPIVPKPAIRSVGEPVVRCPTEAIARRPTSTSRVRIAHHPGHAVVRPPAARRLSGWRCASALGGPSGGQPARMQSCGQRRDDRRDPDVADALVRFPGVRMLKAIVRNTPMHAVDRDAGGASAAAATESESLRCASAALASARGRGSTLEPGGRYLTQ